MKYIRTKDGIYEYVDYDNECIIPMPIIKYKGQLTHCDECDIIKQANTIERLCDEFVDTSELKTTNTGGWLYDEFDSKNKCLIYYAEDERRTIPLNEFDDLSKIYGAIWCEWGLKYVAKINKNGELELI